MPSLLNCLPRAVRRRPSAHFESEYTLIVFCGSAPNIPREVGIIKQVKKTHKLLPIDKVWHCPTPILPTDPLKHSTTSRTIEEDSQGQLTFGLQERMVMWIGVLCLVYHECKLVWWFGQHSRVPHEHRRRLWLSRTIGIVLKDNLIVLGGQLQDT